MSSIRHVKSVILFFHKLFQGRQKEGTFPYAFYEASLTLIPNPIRRVLRTENYRSGSLRKIYTKVLHTIVAHPIFEVQKSVNNIP